MVGLCFCKDVGMVCALDHFKIVVGHLHGELVRGSWCCVGG